MDSNFTSCVKHHASFFSPPSFAHPIRCWETPGRRPSSIDYVHRISYPFLRGVRYSLNELRYTIHLSPKRKTALKRNAPFRSEFSADDGSSYSASSSFTQTEFVLGSKTRTRGFMFYILSIVVAIPLFVAMVVIHPFVILFDRYRRNAHHFIAKLWANITIYPFYHTEFEGLDNLPSNDTSAVYVSNHQSFLDIYTLLTLGRNFKFISKRAIFFLPVGGWAMNLMGLIPLRRMDGRSQLECLKRCIKFVEKGASVFFFPEGTRSKDGKLGTFKKGAFSVAAKTGVPVVPITLLGAGKLMPAGMEQHLSMGSVKVVIHKPIEGSDGNQLCTDARDTIARTLLTHGYGVHGSD